MNKAHLTILAVLVASAAVLGAVAVTRTTHLGAASRAAQDKAVATQAHQLAAYAASLRKQLHSKPPALPAVPKAKPATGGSAAPRVVYQQPPPVVVTLHRHTDDGSDGGGEGND